MELDDTGLVGVDDAVRFELGELVGRAQGLPLCVGGPGLAWFAQSAAGGGAIEADLAHGGVHRYAADTFYGGGQWPVLAALLAGHHVRVGSHDRAWQLLDWVVSTADSDLFLPVCPPAALVARGVPGSSSFRLGVRCRLPAPGSGSVSVVDLLVVRRPGSSYAGSGCPARSASS